MEKQKSVEIDLLYQKFEEKLKSFDPKKNPPPIITNFFEPLKVELFKNVQKIIQGYDEVSRNQEVIRFIETVDLKLLSDFKKQIKDVYILRTLDRDYNVPTYVDTREAKSFHVNEELNQLAEHIADWSVELEMLSDLLNSVEMYTAIKLPHLKTEYFKAFENEFKPRGFSVVRGLMDRVLKRVVGVILKRITHLAMIKGINRMQFTGTVLMQIMYEIAVRKVIPWTIMFRFINTPWMLGSVALYSAVNYIGHYIEKEDVKSCISQCDDSIVSNKLYMKEVRADITGQIIKMLQGSPNPSILEENKLEIQQKIESLMNQEKIKKEIDSITIHPENDQVFAEALINMTDCEDYVVVENVTFEEEQTEDDFVVVSRK